MRPRGDLPGGEKLGFIYGSSGHPWVNVPPILWLRLGVSLLNLPGMPTAVTAGNFPLREVANVLS